MQPVVQIAIPQEWLKGVSDEEITLQHIFRLGLYQYHIERALTMYQDGVGSLGYIAEQTNIPKQELLREARLRGIDPECTEQTVWEEVG